MARADLRYTLLVYALSRVLYLEIALADLVYGRPLANEIQRWDGKWYVMAAVDGYPHHVVHGQSTLGFFPVYPVAMWVVAHVFFCGYEVAGVLIATVAGGVSTVLVGKVASSWWGDSAYRRAVLFFCLFPGSIVSSMVYADGLMIALLAGCLLVAGPRLSVHHE